MTDIKRTIMDSTKVSSGVAMQRIASVCGALGLHGMTEANEEQRELILEHGIANTLPPVSVVEQTLPAESESLPNLATFINDVQATLVGQAGQMIDLAIVQGEALLMAKAKVKHGEWSAWVESNLTFGAAQATKYMRLGENPKLAAKLASGQDLNSVASIYKAIGVSLKPPVIPTHTEDAEIVSEKKAPPAEIIMQNRIDELEAEVVPTVTLVNFLTRGGSPRARGWCVNRIMLPGFAAILSPRYEWSASRHT